MHVESHEKRGLDEQNTSNQYALTSDTDFTPRQYAADVNNFADIPPDGCLISGFNFRNLAAFLWQPYEFHASNPAFQQAASNSRSASDFLSLCDLSSGSSFLFDTVERFLHLGDEALPPEGQGRVLFLRGYPSPEWLNCIGAKFRIDPEFFQRHLTPKSESSYISPPFTAAPSLPSSQADMVALHITTIGSLMGGARTRLVQKELDILRDAAAHSMADYLSHLSSLHSPKIALADSIVREFSIHDFDHFSIEQKLSIKVVPRGRSWIAAIWMDVGRDLYEGWSGPWQRPDGNQRTAADIDYIPTIMHVPNIAFENLHPRSRSKAQRRCVQSAQILHEDYGLQMDTNRASYDLFYAISPLFRFALFSEMAFLELISSKIRREVNHTSLILQGNHTLSNLVFHQQIIKRHIEYMQDPITFLEGLPDQSWFVSMTSAQQDTCVRSARVMTKDFKAALQRGQSLLEECVRGMSIVAQNAATLEAQKAFEEARSVGKLTRLAMVFVPLSFATSAFGMNISELGADDAPSIWIWVVLSAGLSLMTYVLFRWNTLIQIAKNSIRAKLSAYVDTQGGSC